jgi:hypothetical protein
MNAVPFGIMLQPIIHRFSSFVSCGGRRYAATGLFCALLLAGCATSAGYYQKIDGLMYSGRFAEAATLSDQSKNSVYGSKSLLLYHLDRGLLLHYAGEYADSNVHFEKAKRLAATYFTKSISAEASTLLVNDAQRPYAGEDFERALIHVFAALNYACLSQESEALVEARQVDHFLKTLQVNQGADAQYKEDAFVRYVMGMLYENQGDVNNAFISYRKALEAYARYHEYYSVPAPADLIADAARTARKLGFRDEEREILRDWGTVSRSTAAVAGGEAVILAYTGFSAEKIDSVFEIAFGKAWSFVGGFSVQGKDAQQIDQAGTIARAILSDEQVRVAFPRYARVPSVIATVTARAEASDVSVSGVIVEDISAIAEKNLDERITRVRVRAIARAAVKFALARGLSQKIEERSGNEALGWIARKTLAVASAATEHADTRSWRSLPDRIMMMRLPLPSGTQAIVVTFIDGTGMERSTRRWENVQITDGKKTFIVVRIAQ